MHTSWCMVASWKLEGSCPDCALFLVHCATPEMGHREMSNVRRRATHQVLARRGTGSRLTHRAGAEENWQAWKTWMKSCSPGGRLNISAKRRKEHRGDMLEPALQHGFTCEPGIVRVNHQKEGSPTGRRAKHILCRLVGPLFASHQNLNIHSQKKKQHATFTTSQRLDNL